MQKTCSETLTAILKTYNTERKQIIGETDYKDLTLESLLGEILAFLKQCMQNIWPYSW